MNTSQQRLGFFLAMFASLVLLLGTLQGALAALLTARQAWVNLAVALVVSGILVWPFPGLVQSFCMVMRMTAPAAAIFAVVRGRYDLIAPLVLLGVVFQLCLWLAEFVMRGGGPRDLPSAAARAWRRLSGREPRPPAQPGSPSSGGGLVIIRTAETSDEGAGTNTDDGEGESARANPSPTPPDQVP